jgi:hypothetical protein
MTETIELENARREAAESYRQATTSLAAAGMALTAARGQINIQTLATNLAAWHWGRAVNALHGEPAGPGPTASSLNRAVTIAYCKELGISTEQGANGVPTGASMIGTFRRLAARIATEEHLRELTAECGTYQRISESLTSGKPGAEVKKARAEQDSHSRAYGRYAPPQGWSSYLVQQGLDRKQVSAAMRVSLEAIGPEESFKLWDRAGRPAT